MPRCYYARYVAARHADTTLSLFSDAPRFDAAADTITFADRCCRLYFDITPAMPIIFYDADDTRMILFSFFSFRHFRSYFASANDYISASDIISRCLILLIYRCLFSYAARDIIFTIALQTLFFLYAAYFRCHAATPDFRFAAYYFRRRFRHADISFRRCCFR